MFDVTKKTNIRGGSIVFDTFKEEFTVRVNSLAADSIYRLVTHALFDAGTNEHQEESRNVVTQLKEFKELLDAGILTEEEFSAKKAEILGL
jgi:hypothetical protein